MNTLHSLREKLPSVIRWIEETLTAFDEGARPVSSFGFKRLPCFFSDKLLATAKVVLVDKVPVPPLASLGLPEFAAFASGDYAGITFKDTYFLKASEANSESLHFHELVHIVQWRELGVENFLLRYAAGLANHGYRNSPLEDLAYKLQAAFDQGEPPCDLEGRLAALLPNLPL